MNATLKNSKPRQSLADQIDRLDGILDGLADGLNEAVVTAVKEAARTAVQEAVRQALVEVLTNPDVLDLIGGAARMRQPSAEQPGPTEPASPGLGERLGAAWAWVTQKVRAAGAACRQGLNVLTAGLAWLWNLRKGLLAGIGAAVGLGAYFAGPWLIAKVSIALGFAAALFCRAKDWLQRWFLGWVFADAAS